MVTIKSAREIELMKEAGRITAYAHEQVRKAIKPGISTYELDKIAYDAIISQGAIPSFLNYNGFPGSICASINEVVVHGIPNKKTILKNGDIISIDIGAIYRGYHGDAARTHYVGEVDEKVKQLVRVTKQSFFEGIKYAKPGNRLTDISHAIGSYAESFGYGVVRDFTGHGVGTHLHEDPAIFNFGEAGHGIVLKKGMTLAIEPMITLGTYKVRVLSDGWTTKTLDNLPAAHFENTIVITEDGCEILTKYEGENLDV